MLTEIAIKAAKSKSKPYKLYDERGLYLLVAVTGKKLWRFKYKHAGKEKVLSIGDHHDITLRDARDKRDAARKLVLNGVDPSAHKQEAKAKQSDSLEAIYKEWTAKQAGRLSESTLIRDRGRLDTYILPKLGRRYIVDIKAADLLMQLRKMEAKGIHESAIRTRALCGQVWRYAVATGRVERDITQDLKGALTPPKTKNMAAITDPRKIADLLRAIDTYQGQPATGYALQLAPLLFVRPGELRHAEWSEFELTSKEPSWRIPANKTKMRTEHIVPLALQSVAIIEELKRLTGDGKYLFPSLRSPARPMSDGTLNAALRRLGFDGSEMVAHGFRAMASTQLNEQGWHPDLIELQLAHKERNKIRAAYNRATRLPERRKMMQSWAGYLDSLRAGAQVIPIKRGA